MKELGCCCDVLLVYRVFNIHSKKVEHVVIHKPPWLLPKVVYHSLIVPLELVLEPDITCLCYLLFSVINGMFLLEGVREEVPAREAF